MKNDDMEAIGTLAKVINNAARTAAEEALFDKTISGVVVGISNNDYIVQCLGAERILSNKSGQSFSVGDSVSVLIPMNNTNNMFICGGHGNSTSSQAKVLSYAEIVSIVNAAYNKVF